MNNTEIALQVLRREHYELLKEMEYVAVEKRAKKKGEQVQLPWRLDR